MHCDICLIRRVDISIILTNLCWSYHFQILDNVSCCCVNSLKPVILLYDRKGIYTIVFITDLSNDNRNKDYQTNFHNQYIVHLYKHDVWLRNMYHPKHMSNKPAFVSIFWQCVTLHFLGLCLIKFSTTLHTTYTLVYSSTTIWQSRVS